MAIMDVWLYSLLQTPNLTTHFASLDTSLLPHLPYALHHHKPFWQMPTSYQCQFALHIIHHLPPSTHAPLLPLALEVLYHHDTSSSATTHLESCLPRATCMRSRYIVHFLLVKVSSSPSHLL